MSDALLFAIGSVIFLVTSLATLRFMAYRFSELAAASTEATNPAPNEQRRSTNA